MNDIETKTGTNNSTENKTKQFHMRVSPVELTSWYDTANVLGYRSLSELVREAVSQMIDTTVEQLREEV